MRKLSEYLTKKKITIILENWNGIRTNEKEMK